MQIHKPKYIHVAEAAETPQTVSVNRNHWSQKDTEQWRGTHMREYFYDQYLDHVGIPHIVAGSKHSGMMNRVAKQLGGPEDVRLYINAMFEMKLKNNTLEVFSTSKRLGEIREYLHRAHSVAPTPVVTPAQPATSSATLNSLLGGE